MNAKRLKRLIAAASSAMIMMTATPVVNTYNTFAYTNLISNSTFDGSSSGWGTYKESQGVSTLGVENGKLALKISNVGKVSYANQMYYDIIPLYKNGVYHLKYDISCTTNRFVEGMIQQNGGDYTAYTWKGLNISPTPQTVDYTFTMKYDTDIMSKLVFNCGLQESDPALPEHTIYLDNVVLELVDDSGVDYSGTRPKEEPIVVNQVGYRTNAAKKAVFRNASSQTSFSVVNASTGQSVYNGTLSAEVNNTSANEKDKTGDFSSVKTPGTYYLTCGTDKSYTFEIGDNVYKNLLDDSVRMLYLQRCGTEIKDNKFSHVACHNTMATIYHTSEKIDVTGGWHDAGDYGRYVVPGAKSVADLLYAYEANPSMFGDSIGIPESGNGTPDILDEAKYELDWMLKMQRSDGGVYHKVTCENFPSYCMPQEETKELIVTPVSSTATADFCAAMALAGQVYQKTNKSFADKCMAAAQKAWQYLEQNPNFDFTNPSDITTGDYGDTSDRDERYWAACQMYRATGQKTYLDKLSSFGSSAKTGFNWMTVGDYGNLALLTMDGIDKNSEAYQTAKSKIVSAADDYLKNANNSPYGSSLTKYDWGSNMLIATNGMTMALAYQLTGNSSYISGATAQLDYLLGENAVAKCFVTGYGSDSPKTPHHRPSMKVGEAMKGMLVGGVDQMLEDSAAKAYCQDQPAAKRYVDNSESYSTNEITIYWNSPLTYLLALTDGAASMGGQETTSTPGDVNGDGKVNVIDLICLERMLTNRMAKTAGADVDGNGIVNTADAVALQKFLVKKTSGSAASGDMPVDPVVTHPEWITPPVVTTTTTVAATSYNLPVVTTATQAVTPVNNAMNQSAQMVADFSKGESRYFYASDGWTNGSCFDCGWYKSNTSFVNGALELKIDKDYSGKYHYSGAEYRTNDFYHYGYYETSMKAIKNDGVVSSFFTYTGPTDNNPWDEIDVEILGKDTTKVQFNYYTNGVGNHEFMYDLGFDSSADFHTYGFDWQPNYIAWYVDGREVYRATTDIPKTPGKIMMNTWPGTGVDEWLKPYNGNTPLKAYYKWVTYDKNCHH